MLHLFFLSQEVSYGSVYNDVYVSIREVYKHYFSLAAKVLPFVRCVVKIYLTCSQFLSFSCITYRFPSLERHDAHKWHEKKTQIYG